MDRIIINLWFDNQAEEAANFYASVFKNSKVGKVTPYPKAAEEVSGKPAGSAMTVEFEINGQPFIGLNGGPVFKFTEAVSFVINCDSQEEVDELWEKLSAHPESEQCGWLKDKFGVSWQIIPKALNELLADPDPQKADRVMKAMLEMKKIDVAGLQAAYDQK